MILAKHQPRGPHSCILILDHLKPGHNVGKIIRTANALGLFEVHLVGIGQFDTAHARGSVKQTRVLAFERIEDSFSILENEGFQIFALDPKGEHTLGMTPFPEKTAFVVGHEEFGLSFKKENYPAVQFLNIPQFGNVESLNVSIAASIAAFEHLRQQGWARK